jgi:hypothetical protein
MLFPTLSTASAARNVDGQTKFLTTALALSLNHEEEEPDFVRLKKSMGAVEHEPEEHQT